MLLTEEQTRGLNTALNEADLLGIEIDPNRGIAASTFRVLTLPLMGPPPEDRRVQFLFRPIGRAAASLRNGQWNNPDAEVVKFEVTDLLKTVQSFGGCPIYGWKFFEVPSDQNFDKWASRLSLDFQSGADGLSHTIDLFQAGRERHLDVRFWFDEFMIRAAKGTEIPLGEFTEGGKRWWDGLNKGDERTKSAGIFPLKR